MTIGRGRAQLSFGEEGGCVSGKFSATELFAEVPEITIVDVGASINGDKPEPHADLVARKHARVIGFEPNREERKKLHEKYGAGYTFLSHFVGNGEQATFYETTWALTGSLFKPNAALLERFQTLKQAMSEVATHPVQTHCLDNIPEALAFDYLKLDTQGSELDILKGARQGLAECLMVQVEVEFVHMYHDQPLFADVDQFMRECGFQFHKFSSTSSRCFKPCILDSDLNSQGSQALWADAVYVRDFMTFDQLAADQLIKLAILLHDLYDSWDMCIAILAELDRRGLFGARLQSAYGTRLSALLAANRL